MSNINDGSIHSSSIYITRDKIDSNFLSFDKDDICVNHHDYEKSHSLDILQCLTCKNLNEEVLSFKLHQNTKKIVTEINMKCTESFEENWKAIDMKLKNSLKYSKNVSKNTTAKTSCETLDIEKIKNLKIKSKISEKLSNLAQSVKQEPNRKKNDTDFDNFILKKKEYLKNFLRKNKQCKEEINEITNEEEIEYDYNDTLNIVEKVNKISNKNKKSFLKEYENNTTNTKLQTTINNLFQMNTQKLTETQTHTYTRSLTTQAKNTTIKTAKFNMSHSQSNKTLATKIVKILDNFIREYKIVNYKLERNQRPDDIVCGSNSLKFQTRMQTTSYFNKNGHSLYSEYKRNDIRRNTICFTTEKTCKDLSVLEDNVMRTTSHR